MSHFFSVESLGIRNWRLASFKDKEFANQLVKKAQIRRKQVSIKQAELSLVDLDYIFIHEVHSLLDAELIEIGESFYLPTLRQLWKNEVSEQVLFSKF